MFLATAKLKVKLKLRSEYGAFYNLRNNWHKQVTDHLSVVVLSFKKVSCVL